MPVLDNFRAARWFRTANLLLQAGLFLTFFGGLNYLAGRHPVPLTLPAYRPLSAETLAYLQNLSGPVAITVTVPKSSASSEVAGLLREYAAATESGPERRITVEYLDVDASRRRAQELGIDEANLIFIQSGTKHRVLPIDELYQRRNGERRAFQGEQMVTAAILDVSNPERKKIYFLVDHGELRPEDTDPGRGLSVAREQLRQRDFDVDTLDLTLARQIPKDASLLIAVRPLSPYTAFEQEMLRQYLGTNAGRLILFLAAGAPHGLPDLLRDWGVQVDDDLLCDTGTANVTEDNDLIVHAQPHPVTQNLINYKLPLRISPSARTVRPDPAGVAGNGVDVQVIAASSATAWGEMSYRARGGGASRYDAGVDLRGTPGLGVAVAAERVAGRDNLPFSVPRGRLVVFGTGDLIANNRISDAAAESIFFGAVDWTVDRDIMLRIPPRPIERYQLSLSARELNRLRFSLLFALPIAIGLLGLVVYWARRT